jgi:Na+/proline symporter
MTRLLPIVSIAGLAAVFLPAVAYLLDWLEKDTMTTIMLVGTIVWFATAPLWMGQSIAGAPGQQDTQGRI